MTKILIYEAEIKDGLAKAIASQGSVAYCTEPSLFKGMPNILKDGPIKDKVLAENQDQKDLYYLESVLVSTGWNKNDDVFLPENVWSARATPEDKQFNFMHDENDIIGHITGSYVLSKDGTVLEDTEASAPEDFDIITQAVLYNSWTNLENRERMSRIIAEIQDNKWYVSMECLFAGFDYAILDKEGKGKVLARNEESAFLTKYLRSYGGDGEYEGYKIGRALKEIVFSGKGLVSKPANPRSIILNSYSVASFKDNISNFSIGENNMSVEVQTLEKQLAEVKAELVLTREENKVAKAQIEAAKDKEFAAKVQAFETEITQQTQTVAEMEELVKSTQARIAELEDALAKSGEQLSVAMKDMETMKKKEKSAKRKASLLEAGFDETEAEEALVKFDSVQDESFEFIIAAMKKKAPWMKEDKKEEKKEEANVSEAFDKVETTEASLVETEETTNVETARANIASWIEKNVLSKKK